MQSKAVRVSLSSEGATANRSSGLGEAQGARRLRGDEQQEWPEAGDTVYPAAILVTTQNLVNLKLLKGLSRDAGSI